MPDQEPSAAPKPTNSAVLWDIAQTFSNEAQSAAKKKALELNYLLDRGDIPFEETLINLSLDRDVLLKSIETSALPQLPLKIQNSLVADARKVSTHLAALISGTDAVIPFGSAVDDLTADIWYSNLQNMSGEVLGLQEKLNQLKTLEKTLRQLGERSDAFRKTEENAEHTVKRLQEFVSDAETSAARVAKHATEVQQHSDTVKSTEQQIQAALTIAQQNEKGSVESASTARAASGEIEAIRVRANTLTPELEQAKAGYESLTTQLSAFRSQTELTLKAAQETQAADHARLSKSVDEKVNQVLEDLRTAETSRELASSAQLTASKTAFETEATKAITSTKTALVEIETRARSVAEENERKTTERFDELQKLEDVVREKIRLATNYQLFHSFQTRQFAIVTEKKFWRNALFAVVGVSFLLSIALIVYLFEATITYNATFFLKLAISIPLVYAIHLCSSQFSRERKLEEEYAFKSNISISLEPYRELVEKMIDKGDPAEATKYSDFVIKTIDNVFTSPTQPVFGSADRKDTSDEIADTSKGLTKILGSFNDLIQSLAKFK